MGVIYFLPQQWRASTLKQCHADGGAFVCFREKGHRKEKYLQSVQERQHLGRNLERNLLYR